MIHLHGFAREQAMIDGFKMRLPRGLSRAAGKLLWVALLGLAAGAQAQSWPSRPVRVIVPFPAGGSTMEQVVRMLTQDMPKTLGQAIIVDSRPGAGTVIGVDLAAK